jgi:hypothetical protein
MFFMIEKLVLLWLVVASYAAESTLAKVQALRGN